MIVVIRRTNLSKWNRDKMSWKSFLKGIGGVHHLSFGWTRQSGNPWGYGVIGDSRKRHTLRGLIREGVSEKRSEESVDSF